MTLRRCLTALLVATAVAASGCSDDAKKVDPKLAPGQTPDARLKPESTGNGSASKGAIKGD